MYYSEEEGNFLIYIYNGFLNNYTINNLYTVKVL